MNASRIVRAALACAALSSLAWMGCSRQPTGVPATKADQVYTVRGQIAMLPDPAKPSSELQIRHEPIPSFVNKEGKVVGMNAMIMPFTPSPALRQSEFSVGDIVEFTFEVRWTSRPASFVTEMRKLPVGTVLDFGRAPGN